MGAEVNNTSKELSQKLVCVRACSGPGAQEVLSWWLPWDVDTGTRCLSNTHDTANLYVAWDM